MFLQSFSSTLICPYSLIEEEALYWSILLFNRAILLHPYPLTLPENYQALADQGLIQIRSPERTPEEIRIKDKRLREIQAFIAGNPDQAFLKYLHQISQMEDEESREEIIGFLKGESLPKDPKASSSLSGSILLCLIHDWLIQERAIETALSRADEQEKLLVQGWQEGPEEGLVCPAVNPVVLKKKERELPCPLALKTWWELKNQLFPEPAPLVTTQPWVWVDYYGLDPAEVRTISISLPDLSSLGLAGFRQQAKEWVAQGNGITLQESFKGLLQSPFGPDLEKSTVEFQKSLAALGYPKGGQYSLILPPIPILSAEPKDSFQLEQEGAGFLILLTSGSF